jgi:hypothetical protein
MTDRRTKLLLCIIAGALCVIALRPLFPTRNVSAQTAAPGAPAPAPPQISYQLVEENQPFQAEAKINKLATQGWRARNVAVSTDKTVVLMEKTTK